jgi:hypothetical protein
VFRDKNNWNLIERGFIFEAAMYFHSDTKRPLSFFIRDDDNPYRGTVVGKDGDFSPAFKNGKPIAVTQEVIVGVKPRKVLIISETLFNQSQSFEYIQVAPVMGISDSDKQDIDWYDDLINDKDPLFIYLPQYCTAGITKDSYVDVSELTSIHKSMLLKKYGDLPPDRLDLVEQRILGWLDIGEKPEESGDAAY